MKERQGVEITLYAGGEVYEIDAWQFCRERCSHRPEFRGGVVAGFGDRRVGVQREFPGLYMLLEDFGVARRDTSAVPGGGDEIGTFLENCYFLERRGEGYVYLDLCLRTRMWLFRDCEIFPSSSGRRRRVLLWMLRRSIAK